MVIQNMAKTLYAEFQQVGKFKDRCVVTKKIALLFLFVMTFIFYFLDSLIYWI
jgi:hypothetical protein